MTHDTPAQAAEKASKREQMARALRAVEGELSPEQERERAALAPWTRVNNCTATPTLDRLDRRHMDTGPASFGPLKVRRAKLGRWFDWNQDRAGGPNSHERATT